MKPKVLVCDPIDESALGDLGEFADVETLGKGETLQSTKLDLSLYDAILVRSRTKVTEEALSRMDALKVIGRAGVGVDNIDVEEATRRGIIVLTSPSGNTFSVAQHAVALMLAHFTHIASGSRYLREGQWRKDLVGQELRGKVMGIVGLGRIGSEVARLARNLGMEVVAHDPYVSEERAKTLGVALMSLEDLLSRSHVVSLHIPFSSATEGLIGERELALMRSDSFLINTARGGVVDERALLEALAAHRIAGAGLDVFSQEPPKEENQILRSLIAQENVIATPHIAASTKEAQERVGEEVVRGIRAVFEGKIPVNAYNMPFIVGDESREILAFVEVAEILGNFALRLSGGRIERVSCSFEGPIAEHDTRILKAAFLTGLLKEVVAYPVTIVNAAGIARSRGIEVLETKHSGGNRAVIRVSCGSGKEAISVGATRDEEGIKLIAINDYPVAIRKPDHESYLLFLGHRDRPGMVGQIGTILGEANINIAFMDVGRQAPRGDAVMVVVLDDPIPEEVLTRIRGISEIRFVKYAKF